MKEEITRKIKTEIENLVAVYSPAGYTKEEYENIMRGFSEIVPFDDKSQTNLKLQIENLKLSEKIGEFLLKLVSDLYESRERQLGPEFSREIEKFAYLSSIDHLWMDHLDALDDLREGIGLRGYGQRDPLVEYKNEAFQMFERLVAQIDHEVVRRIFRIQVAKVANPPAGGSQNVQTNIDASDQTGLAQKPVIAAKKKIGRNDPCWCGSGKKWKKCHYPQLPVS